MSRPGPHEPRARWRGRAVLGLALALGLGAPLLWLMADGGATASAVAVAQAAPPSEAAPGPAPVVEGAAPMPAPPQAAAPVLAMAAAPQPAGAPAAPQIPRLRDPAGDTSPDLADFVNPGEVPTMADVIERLRAAGVTGGLAAFNPPGTRPALEGNAAPEGTELPPGYVRHYQFTDDGRRLEPILLFAPDHPVVVAAVQAAGAPVSLQARDLVVPAALVPAGVPVRRIVVPPPAEPGK